jgi:hypothetical protein
MNLKVDPQDLRKFFQEKEDDDIGNPCDSENCPLSVYFWARHNLDVIVGNEKLHIRHSPETARNLELWERRFITGIDDGTYEKPECVYGSEALEVLDEVLARED